LNSFLQSISQEFSIYTYSMLNAGIDMDSIRNLSEDQLLVECGITNSIHRLRILDAIKNMQHNQFSSYEYKSPDTLTSSSIIVLLASGESVEGIYSCGALRFSSTSRGLRPASLTTTCYRASGRPNTSSLYLHPRLWRDVYKTASARIEYLG